jgi:hypothetical protein
MIIDKLQEFRQQLYNKLLRFNHLLQATIHRLNRIGSINRPANLRGETNLCTSLA